MARLHYKARDGWTQENGMNTHNLERIALLRAARSLAVQNRTVSASVLRAPCTASQINVYFDN